MILRIFVSEAISIMHIQPSSPATLFIFFQHIILFRDKHLTLAQLNSMSLFVEEDIFIPTVPSSEITGETDSVQPSSLGDNFTSQQMMDFNAANNPIIYNAEAGNPFYTSTGLFAASNENLMTSLMQVHSSINGEVIPLPNNQIASMPIPATVKTATNNILNSGATGKGAIARNEIGSLFARNNFVPSEADPNVNDIPMDQTLTEGTANMVKAITHRAHARAANNTIISNVSRAKRVNSGGNRAGDKISIRQTIAKRNSSKSPRLDAIPSSMIEYNKAESIPARQNSFHQASQSPCLVQRTSYKDHVNAIIDGLPSYQESFKSLSQVEPSTNITFPPFGNAVQHLPFMGTVADHSIQPPSKQSACFLSHMDASTVGQKRDARASTQKSAEAANLMQRSDRVGDVTLNDHDLLVEDDSDDEGGRCKKIKMKYIGRKRNRQVTFLKRKNGVMKKAMELVCIFTSSHFTFSSNYSHLPL